MKFDKKSININEESRHSTKETDNQRSTCIGKVRRPKVNTIIYLLIVGINMQVAKEQHQHPRWPTIDQTIYDNRQLSAMQKLYTCGGWAATA